MTDEILPLMEECRKFKNINLHIRSEIRKAKRKWLEDECRKIERLQAMHNTHGEHIKLKEAAGIYRSRPVYVLKHNSNENVTEETDKSDPWKTYIENLFVNTKQQFKLIWSSNSNKRDQTIYIRS